MSGAYASPPGTVLFEGDKAFLTFQRRLPHPPEAVWAALTEPDQLAVWCLTEAKIDGRQGGSIDYRSGPIRMHITGRILEWDPPRVFEHEWRIAPGPGLPNGEEAVIRYELEGEGEETILTVTHRNVSRLTALGVGPAIHVLLDRLAAQLGGEPLPGLERFTDVRKHYPYRTEEEERRWLARWK